MFVIRHAIASSSPDYIAVWVVGGDGVVACRLKMYAIGSFAPEWYCMSSMLLQTCGVLSGKGLLHVCH